MMKKGMMKKGMTTHSESDFHIALIRALRKESKNPSSLLYRTIVDGHSVGNLSQSETVARKILGYPVNCADIMIRRASSDKKYKGLCLELKKGDARPRPEQARFLCAFEALGFYPAWLASGPSIKSSVAEGVELVKAYVRSDYTALDAHRVEDTLQ